MTNMVDRIRAQLEKWRKDPVAFVVEELHAIPDAWQADALRAFAAVERLCLKACKGPGKTALLAWCILNFLATRPHPKVACTSITEDNLHDNLWPELAKWMGRSLFLSRAFTWSKTRIVNNSDPENWFATARTWPKQADSQRQADTLAGIHAEHVLFALDESGGIPQAVMTTAEAVLATGTETKVLQAGNPTHLEGPLHRACTTDRHLWHIVTITGDPDDPKRSPRIKLDWAKQQIASYGRENPWVMVNVLGQFPPASINALLGLEEVEAAMRRKLQPHEYDWAQKRLGIDVARFGDDRTVIFPRQGMAAFWPIVLRNQRTTSIAARIAKAHADWGSELHLVDDTGHWGHGVIDNLITAGIPGVVGVVYHEKALNPRYKNRRTEIWLNLADWVKSGGALPNIPELVAELTTPTYTFAAGRFQLEEKDQIKERLGRSPDLGDGIANTFALPDMPGTHTLEGRLLARKAHTTEHEWDPFADPGVIYR